MHLQEGDVGYVQVSRPGSIENIGHRACRGLRVQSQDKPAKQRPKARQPSPVEANKKRKGVPHMAERHTVLEPAGNSTTNPTADAAEALRQANLRAERAEQELRRLKGKSAAGSASSESESAQSASSEGAKRSGTTTDAPARSRPAKLSQPSARTP